MDFFTEYGEGNRYKIEEVIGKGSYGVVCSALDTHTGEKVAIKKINDIFEHVSDATRILREIKLLRLLRHPDIVEIKHILLPPSRREFKDIYVVFELMESDLHQVIKANDDLTPEHYQFFLYQLLRGLKYIHTANVFHRDLKPKNILANADCKLKICDFGLARVAFSDTPTAIFWTDYVATRWYRAPELCGSFFSKYTPAIDIWSIGCIFAELLTGKPLFPGKNVVHQLDIITDLLGTPSTEAISRIRNEKARRYLSSMRRKKPISFMQKFPNADPLALRLLERMLSFEPKDRPNAEEALADPYFRNIANVDREPSAQPVTKLEFEFERRRITKEDIRELIYREILEYHPNMLREYLEGTESAGFMYPSLHTLKNIMLRDQQQLHLRGNITLYQDLLCYIRMIVHKAQPTLLRIFQSVYLEIIHKKCIKVPLLFAQIEFLKAVLQDLVKLLVLHFDMVTAQHLLLSNMSIDEPIETQHWLLTLFLPEALNPEEIHLARLKQVILKGSM
uniref:mitogen-activated protein kinase n=1 Tax=Oryza punctata TaxID=4537 RepID=A0A0E0MEN3_ORYPU